MTLAPPTSAAALAAHLGVDTKAVRAALYELGLQLIPVGSGGVLVGLRSNGVSPPFTEK